MKQLLCIVKCDILTITEMLLLSFTLFSVLNIGTLKAYSDIDVDINRLSQLPQEENYNKVNSFHERQSASRESKDNVDSQNMNHGSPLLRGNITSKNNKYKIKEPLHVYQPREDPRLFYQSEAYLKMINGKPNEASMLYPKNDMVLAADSDHESLSIQVNRKEQNLFTDGFTPCVRCPRDRTLIAKFGRNRVLLQRPRLSSCLGHFAPRNVHLVHIYGPKFGSLVEKGSHIIIARVAYKNRNLHVCKFQVHVLTQGCPTPNNLLAHCDDGSRICKFSCSRAKLELRGVSKLVCGDNLKWKGPLPICEARNWCEQPPPSEHGRISCKGATVGTAARLAEDSKCRVRCARGWHRNRRVDAVCRQGTWTHTLKCYPWRKSNQ